MTAHRKPPLPASFMKNLTPWGTCRWCEQPILSETGEILKRRRWHEGCLGDYHLLTRPAIQRDHVRARDNGVCVDCGEVRVKIADWCQHDYRWRRFVRRGDLPVQVIVIPFDEMRKDWLLGLARPPFFDDDDPQETGPACPVVYAEDWQVDHEIPLWKVAHLPDRERLWYHTLANLRTRCTPDHKRKTRAEAAERAKFKRIKARGGMRESRQRGREPLPF